MTMLSTVLRERGVSDSTVAYKPHAVLDLPSRYLKARKIEQLINWNGLNDEITLLEIGVGSGGIASYFSHCGSKNIRVTGVDVTDSRQVSDDFEFHLVAGTTLPFADSSFDIVISNHVIEHVGGPASQQDHLQEIYRVLKGHGRGYLAVPNRWMLIEPHYKLIFLSYLPPRFRTPYLKLMRRGFFYDCLPLQLFEIEDLFIRANFEYVNRCIDALRLTYSIERPNSLVTRILAAIPDIVLVPFVNIIPTLIYTFKKLETNYP